MCKITPISLVLVLLQVAQVHGDDACLRPCLVAVGTDDEFFGNGVASAGDLNGDGVHDLLVAAPRYPGIPHGEIGRVYVFSGATFEAWITLTPLDDNWSFAWARHLGTSPICAIGDLNSPPDAVSDIVVGSPGYPFTLLDQGRVDVFDGRLASQGVEQVIASIIEPTELTQFGDAVSPLRSASGQPRLAVGSPRHPNGQDYGRVSLFFGAPTVEFLGPVRYQYLGAALANAGDVNGDGWDDVIAGAPDTGLVPPLAESAVFVFSGNPQDPTPIEYSYQEAAFGGRIGVAVAGVGDANHDGRPDFAFGGPGGTYVFSGATGEQLLFLDAVPEFGLAGAADMNGDGLSDIIVGNGVNVLESLSVYNGDDGTLLFRNASPPGAAGFGFSLAAVADINDDGYDDTLIGAPLGMNGRVYLMYGRIPQAGDVNNDGCVDLSDLNLVLTDYGCSTGCCAADANCDGSTNLSDLNMILSLYGQGCP